MYEAHFGMRQRPFRVIPDIECYYPATSHEQALARLTQAIHEDEGLALVTGDPGTGKTILGHVLIERLGDKVCCGFLTNSHFADRTGLLQAICHDLGLPHVGCGEQDLRLALTDFLLKNYEASCRTLLILDEAQHLTPDHLEELRLLGNLEGKRGKAFQIVLLALPEFLEKLELRVLAAFAQRLAVRIRLEPLGLHESADFLLHQVRAAGAAPERIIADEALEMLARGGRGVPRLLNRAAHEAFALAHGAGESAVDTEAALEALCRTGLGEAADTGETELLSTEEQEQAETDGNIDSLPTLPSIAPDSKADTQNNAEMSRDSGRPRRLFATPRRPA